MNLRKSTAGTAPEDDLVGRAVQVIRETPGPDQPPVSAIAAIRCAIAERQLRNRADNTPRSTETDAPRVSWLVLAATVLLMLTAGWLLGFDRSLFSDVAGQITLADGTKYLLFTDGRVTPRLRSDLPTEMR